MGVIWLVEEKLRSKKSFMTLLQGDYAVRGFRSWHSFRLLTQLHEGQDPDLVMIHLENAKYKVDQLNMYINDQFPEALKVFLLPSDLCQLNHAKGTFIFSADIDSFRLSTSLSNLFRLKGVAAKFMRYRDLCFDPENLALKCSHSGDWEQLTMKQGQLLKYLLKNSGRCVPRQELIETVWSRMKVSPRTIDSQVSKLRRRLVALNIDIESIYGGGYVLR